jgi:hypothetical protein
MAIITAPFFRKEVTEHKMYGLIFSMFCHKQFSFQEEFSKTPLQIYTGLQVKYMAFS